LNSVLVNNRANGWKLDKVTLLNNKQTSQQANQATIVLIFWPLYPSVALREEVSI